MRQIEIKEKKYYINASAKSMFEYRKHFNTGLLEDRNKLGIAFANSLSSVNDIKNQKDLERQMIKKNKEMGEGLEILFQILYVLIVDEERPKTFDEFLNQDITVNFTEDWMFDLIDELNENFMI